MNRPAVPGGTGNSNNVDVVVSADISGVKPAMTEAKNEIRALALEVPKAGDAMRETAKAADVLKEGVGSLARDALGDLTEATGASRVGVEALAGSLGGIGAVAGMAAAAVLGLAVAYSTGHKESKGLTDALILTGNVVGQTTGQLNDMALSVSAATGATRGQAAEALKLAVSAGNVASENLGLVADSAVRMERTTGQSVDKTVKQFAELGKEPYEASRKLDGQYNYLTASVLRQIKTLEDQGRTTEAAMLAQNAFADAIANRTGEIEGNLGQIERGWNEIKKSVLGAWDAMKNIGRVKGPQEQIGDLKRQLATGGYDFALTENDIRKQISDLEAQAETEKRIGAEKEKQAAQDKARKVWNEDEVRWLNKREQKEREIAKVRSTGEAAGLDAKEIAGRVARVEEKYAEKTPRGRSGGGGKISDYDQTMRTLAERISVQQLELGSTEKLTAAEKEHAKWLADVDSGRKKLTASEIKAAEAKWQTLLGLEKENAEHQKYLAAVDKQEATNQKAYTATLDRIAAAERETELMGLSEAQISAVEQARLADALAIAAENGATPEMLAALREELTLRGKLTDALSARDLKKFELDDAKKAISDADKEMNEFAKSAAKNMQSALADFLFDPFADGADKMAQKFGQTIQRMIAEAASAQLTQALFGNIGKTGVVGSDSLVGKGMSWLGGLFGGGSSGASSASGLAASATENWIDFGGLGGIPAFAAGIDYVPHDMLALIHQGEKVTPAAQNKPGMQGGAISLTQHFHGPADARTVKRAGAAALREVSAISGNAVRYV